MADGPLDDLPPARARAIVLAVAILILLPLTLPVVLGIRTIGLEAALDNDPLYRREEAPPPRPVTTDSTGIAGDFPRERAIADGLHHGRFDAWSPLACAGHPLWAEQGSPFFPLKWPFYLWPSRVMYDLTLLSRLLIAATGGYVLARLRGLGRGDALVAGGTFELSGALLDQLPFGSFGATSFLPWAVAAAYRLARRPDRRGIGVAALVLGVTALAGQPTIILLVFIAFALALAGLLVRRAVAPPRTILAGGAAVGLGLVIAAPALLSFAELLGAGRSYKYTPVAKLTNVLALDVSRNAAPIALFTPGALTGWSILDAHALATAVGPLVFGLAVAGACAGGLDLSLGLIGAFGVALGTIPEVWTDLVPGLRFILPNYAWPLATLTVTQLAGHGTAIGLRRRGSTLAAIAALVLGPASLALVRDARSPFGMQYATLLHAALGDPGRAAVVLAPLVLATVVLLLLGLVGWPRRVTVWPVVVLAVSTLTQTLVLGPAVWQSRSRVLDESPSPAVEFLRGRLASGQMRFTGLESVGFPMSSRLVGLSDLRCIAPLPVRRYVEFLQASAPLAPPDRLTRFETPPTSPLLDLAATRWVVRGTDSGFDATTFAALPTVYQDRYVVVYERTTALPRARVVHRMEPVADQDAARTRMVARRDAPLDPGLAIVEPDEHGRHPDALADGPQLEPVRIVPTDEPDRVVLETALFGAGLVVLADTYYPGWTARVDGQPASIYPTDLLFRGVRVPAGRHRIELVYTPRYLRRGLVVGVLALLAALAARLWPARH